MAEALGALDGESAVTLSLRHALGLPGFLVLSLVIFFPLVRLFLAAFSEPYSASLLEDEFFWHVFVFTYAQAFASSCLSMVLGTAGALLYSELDFKGRRLMWNFALACFALPSVVLVLAFVGFWGRQGWLGQYGGGLYGWPASV